MADGALQAHTPADLADMFEACDVVRLWPPADAAAFKDGLARLVSGVAVVACWSGDQPRGLLVSSLTGLSTEPPRVLFCIRKAASAHGALLAAPAISLSILAADQAGEATRFSISDLAHERFGDGWAKAPLEPPVLKDALVSFSGPVHCRIDAGSHTIFILDISRATTRDGDPLVYFDRQFGDLAARA